MVYGIIVDGKRKCVKLSIEKYSLEADNLAREEIIRHFLEDEDAKEVRIETRPEEVRNFCEENK